MAVSTAVHIQAPGATLDGDWELPEKARGVVVFAHGSGSGKHSRRNRLVAERLHEERFGTLLVDLLKPEEQDRRFEIAFLAERLSAAAGFARRSGLKLGLYGASTGAAAALMVAAAEPDIRAVVSRGGRPELAGSALEHVLAPTLLVVGGADHPEVVAGNVDASELIHGYRELLIIPGATHLFEERGALEAVAEATADWFGSYLA